MNRLHFIFFLFLFIGLNVHAQDTGFVKDSVVSPVLLKKTSVPGFIQLLSDNRFLNSTGKPALQAQQVRKAESNNDFFYFLLALVLLFGIAKTAWPRYFSNMFRVFFNSSLRQSQLTDQLVQDKFSSLIFNLFFILVSGVFVYLVLQYFNNNNTGETNWALLSISIATFGVIYFVKFLTLKFTGWITGYKQEADIYTFIIFLINKIIAICLLPMVIIIAFADKKIVQVFVLLSFIIIGTMLLMRFFRSYGLLQHRLKIGRFHFFLYIFSVEILPLLLIYKAAMIFLTIKL